MAVTWVKDLYRSELTRGIENTDSSRGVIVSLMKGIADSKANLDTAITAAITKHYTYHPEDDSLPLNTVNARMVRDGHGDNAIVTLVYQKSQSSASSQLLAQVDVEVRQYHDYAEMDATYTDGTSSKAVTAWFSEKEVENGVEERIERNTYRVIDVPIWKLVLRTTTSATPLTHAMINNAGKINELVYTLGGKVFGTSTLRFDGVTVQASEGNTGVLTFENQWHYSFNPFRWYASYPISLEEVGEKQLYATATFTDPPFV